MSPWFMVVLLVDYVGGERSESRGYRDVSKDKRNPHKCNIMLFPNNTRY